MSRRRRVARAGVAGVVAAGAGWTALRRRPGRPVFAACYSVLARLAERGELGDRRRELGARAAGRVLELGAGTGEGFKHYDAPVTSIVAVEPDPAMARRAVRRTREARVPLRIVRARGEQLPFRDGTFDTAVATLVLCSVDDPARSLGELRRVVRPGGKLLFLEHVRAADAGLARWQDRMEKAWGRFSGGCHPNRPTMDSIRRAGFEPVELEAFDLRPGIALVRPHVQGAAVSP